jgi:acetyl esterase/lipase
MALDPQAKALLDQMAAGGVPALNTLSPVDARKMFDMMIQLLGMKPQPVFKVEDRQIPGPAGQIRVRVYTPEGNTPFPILVFFHGGGFVIGSVELYDEFCRELTNGIGCVVVSVDYRLAPEHKFPAAVEDCYAATKWVAENASSIGGNASHIAVNGDSAGGNLAAVVAQIARDSKKLPLVYQVLIYPVTGAGYDTQSARENAIGYFLTKDDMMWFDSLYLRNDADRANPRVAPLRAKTLSGLPPALVITAEFDLLRDDGEAYADKLRQSGVPVVCTRYNGMIHGFMGMPFDQGKKARQEVIKALRSAFAK